MKIHLHLGGCVLDELDAATATRNRRSRTQLNIGIQQVSTDYSWRMHEINDNEGTVWVSMK